VIGSVGCGRDRAAGKLGRRSYPTGAPAINSCIERRPFTHAPPRMIRTGRIMETEIAGRNRGGPTSGHGWRRRRSRPLPADPIAARNSGAYPHAEQAIERVAAEGPSDLAPTNVSRSTWP